VFSCRRVSDGGIPANSEDFVPVHLLRDRTQLRDGSCPVSHVPLYLRPDCMKHGKPVVESWDPYSAGDVSAQILHDFHAVSMSARCILVICELYNYYMEYNWGKKASIAHRRVQSECPANTKANSALQ